MTHCETMLEEAVLGGMLLHEGPWPSEVMDLEPEYFQSQHRAEIFQAMQDLVENHKGVDPVSVTARLIGWEMEGHAAYLCQLEGDTPTSANLAHWAGLLVEIGRKRHAERAVREAVARVGSSGSADELAIGVQDALRDIRPRTEGGLRPIRDGIQPTLAELELEHEHPELARIAITGLADLDRIASLRAGELTIIAARPSMGKSALAGNIAAHCGKDQCRGAVAMFSLEMDLISLVRRMMAGASGFATDLLPEKACAGDLVEACAALHGLNLFIDDRPTLTVSAIRQALARLGQIRLVILDYLQLATMDQTDDNFAVRVGRVTKGLKAIAKEFNCHVIALSQLNRSVEARRPPVPRLSDLRDSGEIEQDADNVWFLYRGHYYNVLEPAGVAEIHVAKQRNGKTGIVKVAWRAEAQMFSNLAD